MLRFLQYFFNSNSFITQGHFYLWKPELAWLNIASYSLIFFAYLSISITLVYFVQQREDVPFKRIFLLFGAFILSCGTNHLIDAWTIWYPIYGTSSFIKALTPGVSVCTAVMLMPMIPKVFANLSPAQLEVMNCQLKAEILERRHIEEQLRSSQQMLQLVMDNIPQSIFWKGRNSVFLGCNRNFARIAGVGTPENVVGKTDYDLPWTKEDTRFYRQCDARVMETDTPEYHIIEPVLQADGKQAWVDTNKVPLHDSEGNVVGILGTFEDITERQQTQEALHKEREFLNALLENLAEGIVAYGVDGVLTRFNRVTRELHGLPEEPIPVEEWEHYFRVYLPDAKTRMPKEELPLFRSLQGETVRNQEIVIVPKHGESRTFLVSGQPIIDTQGKKLGAVVVRHDITDAVAAATQRKQAEEALKKANEELEIKVEERTALLKSINEKLQSEIKERIAAEEALRATNQTLQTLLHASPIAIDAVNTEGNVTLWNPAAERLFGWSELEVLGRPLPIVPSDQQEEFRTQFHDELQGEVQIGLEVTRQRKDGSSLDLSLWTAPLFDANGAVIGSMAMFVDLSERVQAEQALRESKEQLQAIIDNSSALIYLLDPQNRHLLSNRGYQNLLSQTNEQLKGKSLYEVWPYELADTFAETNRKVLESRTPIKLEEVVPQDDGLHTYITVKFPLYDANGIPYAVSGISTDITPCKQVQEALRESEAQYRRLIETAEEGIWILDAECKTTFVNAKIAQMLGYTLEEMTGMSLFAFLDAEGQASASQHLERRRQGIAEHYDLQFCRKDGSKLWALISSNPIIDNAGHYVGALGMLTDITERKATEATLLCISKAVESTSDAIGITDSRGKSIYHNPAFIKLFEYTVEELNAARSPSAIFADRAVATEVFAALMRGNYWNGEVELRSKSDRRFQIALRADAIKDQTGQIIGLVGIHTDITQRKQAEEASDRICQTVLCLRNFAKAEQAEKKRVDIHEGLDNTLRILDHRLKAQANYPAIQVIKEYGNLPKVLCYPGQLNQVFMNILTNAIDVLEESVVSSQGSGFSEKTTDNRVFAFVGLGVCAVSGDSLSAQTPQTAISHMAQTPTKDAQRTTDFKPTIRIRTEILDNHQVMIGIADNGPGMTEEVQRKIFDPFFTTKTVGHGTGLGLAISYQIVVEKHGGQLQCISSPGQGTELLIYILNS